MIKTFASSLAAVLTIGSMCASGDAAAGGSQRSVIRAPVRGAVLKPNFGAFNRAHRHGRLFGYGVPLIGYTLMTIRSSMLELTILLRRPATTNLFTGYAARSCTTCARKREAATT